MGGNIYEMLLEAHQVAKTGGSEYFGVEIGVVTNVVDPDKEGRVKVCFPRLPGKPESDWARVVQPAAGSGRGIYWLPHVNDEVLVAFERGQPSKPFVLGSLWNGKDKPMEDAYTDENTTIMVQTKSGHQLILDDKDGEEKMVFADKSGKRTLTFDVKEKKFLIEAAEGDVIIKAKKKIILDCEDLEIHTSETGRLDIGKTFDLKIADTGSIQAGPQLNLKASAIELNPPASFGEVLAAIVAKVRAAAAAAAAAAEHMEALQGGGGGGPGGGGAPGGGGGGSPSQGPGGGDLSSDANRPGGGGDLVSSDAHTAPSGHSADAPESKQVAPEDRAGNTPAPTAIAAQSVDVVVIDALGKARPNERFELRLPTQSVRSGSTGPDGKIHFDNISASGAAHLVLPAHDAEKGRAQGAATQGAMLYIAGGVDVQVGQSTQVEVEPRVYRGRLVGPHFDFDKTFVRPDAMNSIRLLIRFYKEHFSSTPQTSSVLVNGHTDTVGKAGYNLDLSNERAKAMAAFLKDEKEVWLANYHGGAKAGLPWGTIEDRHMLSTLKGNDGEPFYRPSDGNMNAQALLRYQKEKNLKNKSGQPNDETRRALITDYMALDGTSLPTDAPVSFHGCGKNHNLEGHENGDNKEDAENRRVEVFLFEDAITPPVPSGCAPCSEYKQWSDAVVQTVDFRHAAGQFKGFVFEKDDPKRAPIPGALVHLSGATSAEDKSLDTGNVDLKDLAPGKYSVVISADGFADNMVDVEVTEGDAPQRVDLPLGPEVVLEIKEVTFVDSLVVDEDGNGPFKPPQFDRARTTKQRPAVYLRGSAVALDAVLTVKTPPAKALQVAVSTAGTLEDGTAVAWKGTATVNPGDQTASLRLTSTTNLPNKVTFADPFNLAWAASGPKAKKPTAAGISASPLYVLLGKPVTPATKTFVAGSVYWTLADYSCKAAKGTTDRAAFISALFTSNDAGFKNLKMTRRRDDAPLTYWKNRVAGAMDTEMLMQSPDNSGQCGSWASLLIDTYLSHGLTGAQKIQPEVSPVFRISKQKENDPAAQMFMVKTWELDAAVATNPDDWTHTWRNFTNPATAVNAHSGPPLSHQGMGPNTDPPPSFYNHFIVLVDGVYYDPSYGQGPFSSAQDWETRSIDGLLRQLLGVAKNAGFFHHKGRLLRFLSPTAELDPIPLVNR